MAGIRENYNEQQKNLKESELKKGKQGKSGGARQGNIDPGLLGNQQPATPTEAIAGAAADAAIEAANGVVDLFDSMDEVRPSQRAKANSVKEEQAKPDREKIAAQTSATPDVRSSVEPRGNSVLGILANFAGNQHEVSDEEWLGEQGEAIPNAAQVYPNDYVDLLSQEDIDLNSPDIITEEEAINALAKNNGAAKTRVPGKPKGEPLSEEAAVQEEPDLTDIIDEDILSGYAANSEVAESTESKQKTRKPGKPKDAKREMGYSVFRGNYAGASLLGKNFDKMDPRDQIDMLINTYDRDRTRQARKRVEAAGGDVNADLEAFGNDLGSLIGEEYETTDQMEAGGSAENNHFLSGRADLDLKMARLMDKIGKAYRRGFFHVYGEHVRIDEKNNRVTYHWSAPVEDAINGLVRYFGWKDTLPRLEAQRNVFRLVMLYYSLTIDSNGKMFNEDAKEWSMTEDQFIDACRMIFQSCVIYGHPMVMPYFLGYNQKLGGTDIFPCCYIPNQLANALMCEGSNLIDVDRGIKTPADLQALVMREWNERTHPMMEKNLVDRADYRKKEKARRKEKRKKKGKEEEEEKEYKEPSLVAQKIILEKMIHSLSRLDGIGTEEFSKQFDIDTAQHTRISEYRDLMQEYVVVMDDSGNPSINKEGVGNVDVAAVMRRQEEKLAQAEDLWAKRRGPRKHGSGQISAVEASLNLMTSGMRINALATNVPIMMSAVVEKGVGDLQTFLTMKALRYQFTDSESFMPSQELMDAFKTQEASEAIDAALLLFEMGGPQALYKYAKDRLRTGGKLSHDDAMKWLEENVLRIVGSTKAAAVERFNRKLNKISQRILVGDYAFKRKSNMNFLNGLLISNQALAETQAKLAEQGIVDQYGGVVIDAAKLHDGLIAVHGDIAMLITEAIATSAGRDALIQMRSNNIGSINPISYQVSQFMRGHGVTNFAITAWIDTFAKYGINFLHAIMPMSRTIDYLVCKGIEWKGNDLAADLVIGGGMGARNKDFKITDDVGFYNGLRMNLYYDAMSLGRWHFTASLIGVVLLALGWDPPDDPRDLHNVSMWKIGSNIGLGPDVDGDGKGDGIEVQTAYWINDLTQLGLPGGYALATMISTGDLNLSKELFLDSLSDTVDGNVCLDAISAIKNIGEDIGLFAQMANDPNFDGPELNPGYGLSGMAFTLFGKITPFAPTYKSLEKNIFLRGKNAREHSTSSVFDKTDEFTRSVQKTDYIDDPFERQLRRYTKGNWLLALGANYFRNYLSGPDHGESKTGYLWWQMPFVTTPSPVAMAKYDMFKMDYNNLPPGMTREQYEYQRAEDMIRIIDEWNNKYGGPEAAIAAGEYIPSPIRYATADVLFSEIVAMRLDYDAKVNSGWFSSNGINKWQYKDQMDAQISEYYNYIYDWLKNDDIPTWYEEYEQIVTDWDVTYVMPDGSPASFSDRLFNPEVEAVWMLKGNHPNNLSPVTFVDYSTDEEVRRGFSGQTEEYYFYKGKTDPKPILDAYGDYVIPLGKNAGKTVREVIAGGTYTGIYLHLDDLTMGQRSWAEKKYRIDQELKDLNEDNCSGGVYGDLNGTKGNSKSNGGENGMVASSANNGGATGDFGTGLSGLSGGTLSPINSGKSIDPELGEALGNVAGAFDKIAGTQLSVKVNSITKPTRFGQINIDNSKTSGNSYYNKTYYRRRGGGGGGYSYDYNPKIYSNPHSIYGTKPATMYSKTPQTIKNYTYLRPSFSTKGSREAYKRQDF